MSDTLTVTKRDTLGSRASRRLRADGHTPVVLYGHKEPAVSLAASAKELRKTLAHHARMVDLAGDASGQAVIQDVQWDVFHRELLHVDLLRVDAKERVTVAVGIELKGDAVGSREGGVVEQVLTSVDVEAAATNLPEVLHLDISELNLGETMTAGQITDLPKGATLITDADSTVVTCVPPAGEPSLDDVAATGESPEVIGEKKDGED